MSDNKQLLNDLSHCHDDVGNPYQSCGQCSRTRISENQVITCRELLIACEQAIKEQQAQIEALEEALKQAKKDVSDLREYWGEE